MIIKVKEYSHQYEYDSLLSVEQTSIFIVPYAECENKLSKAFELCKDRTSKNNVSLSLRLLNDMPGEGAYLIEAVAKRLNYAMREDNLYWSNKFSSSIASEQTSVDIFGAPVYLYYNAVPQVAQYQKYVPTGTISASCITQQMHSSAWLADTFYDAVNVSSFNGFGRGVVLCSGVDVVPFDVNRNGFPNKYKYTFQFSLKRDGWFPWVYWKGGDDLPPPDLEYGVGYGRLDGLSGMQYAYRPVDFNSIWPFTLPWNTGEEE